MELRTCGITHFIKTISGGRVIIVHNINSQGSSVRSKILKDIYESEDANRLRKPSLGPLFDHEQAKHENPCFPQVDRTLWETKLKNDDEFSCADNNLDSDLDDNTTLSQLRKRFITKKRKCIHTDENSKQDNKRPVEDESDLHEPLINLKPKRARRSKSQRKRMNLAIVSFSTVDFTAKYDEDLVSDGSLQVGGSDPGPVILVEVEIPDSEQLGYQNLSPSADASSSNHDEGVNPGGTSPDEFQSMALCVYREPLFSAQEFQNRFTDKILYDHVEDADPISMLVPCAGLMSVTLESLESECEEVLDLPYLAIQKPEEVIDENNINSLYEDQTSNICIHSSSSIVSDMAFDGIDGCNGLELNSVLSEDITEADLPHELEDSLDSPDNNSGFYLGSTITSKIEENVVSIENTIADEEQPSECSFNVINRSSSNSEGHTEGELLKDEGTIPITDAESQSSSENQTCDIADTISTPEPHLPPENLLSTRKVVSPSSEERLLLAMGTVEIRNDADPNIVSECEGELFEKQTTEKVSSVRSDVQYDKVTVNHSRIDKVRQQKIFISPRHIIRKSQISKANLEGLRFSRTLPNLSTVGTSTQSCSERAILFSKQQMYDMESLALKLMNELKSMKDIVEQKLLFQAYRNGSLKNDAEEVKSAISNASRVEETSKKWLSVMARDCNRFCKIMKMTPPDHTAASNVTVPRDGRKIMFADEAGGDLCQVKIFEDEMTSTVSDNVKE